MRYESDERELDAMEKSMKFDLDENFAKKINSITIDKKDPWAKAIKKACFPKWYVRFWQWIKGLFGVKPKSVPIPPIEVKMNEEFDFQEWVIGRRDEIMEAIRKDGKDKNTITCPICYKEREYELVSTDKQIHSFCDGCGISITQ